MKNNLLLIGKYSDKASEGFEQISKLFYTYFNNKYNVMKLDTKELFKLKTYFKVIKFNPQIVQYIPGPTYKSFLILKTLRILLNNKIKMVVFATRPYLKKNKLIFHKILGINIILTQSFKWEKIFKYYGYRTEFIPNPINLTKFKKIEKSKLELRKRYNIPLYKKLILHVGHIKKNRNLELLAGIQREINTDEYQMIIVGSNYFKTDNKILNLLVDAGCIVLNQYFSNIEEIYNACDYYIFPVLGLEPNYYPTSLEEVGVIDMPLSILEAIACELPVITTPVDSIQVLSKDISNPPIIYFDGSEESFIKALNKADSSVFEFDQIKGRFAKEKVFKEIETIYNKLLE